MAKARKGGSSSPIRIVGLLLVVTALALYLGRESIFGPEVPETPAGEAASGEDSANPGDSSASASGTSADDTPSGEPRLPADQIAGEIVKRLAEDVDEEGTSSSSAASEDDSAADTASASAAGDGDGTATQDPARADTGAAGSAGQSASAAAQDAAATSAAALEGAPDDVARASDPAATDPASPSSTTASDDDSAADAASASAVGDGTGTATQDPAQADAGAAGSAGQSASAAAQDAAATSAAALEGAPDDVARAGDPASPTTTTASEDDSAADTASAAESTAREGAGDTEETHLAREVAARVAEEVAGIVPAPEPGTVARAAAEVADEFGLDVATLAQVVADAVVEDQAKAFITQLTAQEHEPIYVDDADHFVTREQLVSLLPESSIETVSREALLSDPDLGDHTPITLVREVEEIRITDPARLIASAGGDLGQEIKVLRGEEVEVKTVEELLAELLATPVDSIQIVSDVKYFDVTTAEEFAAEHRDDEPLRVVRERYTLEAATVAELLRQELDLPSDSVFYLRTVRSEDRQGIWGIVQQGLSGNFARGMAIRYGKSINTYQVDIPRHADEILPDRSSSFLGRLIYEKVNESYVYNFKHHRMGRSPDRVYPGQEIVIIAFRPEELISIYKHFAGQGGALG